MELIERLSASLFLNFYSFGTLLVTIFTALFAIFFLSLSNKSKSTFHLGLAFLFLSLFNLGYLFASSYYDPGAAYHRWMTVGFILPAILHFGQFFLNYPRNTHPRMARLILRIQYAIAITTTIIFIYVTTQSGKKFHFTGHYWDFDAEPVSKLVAVMIILFSIGNFLITGIWRAYTCQGKERRVILLMVFAMLIAAIVPNYTNIASRDGQLERSTYLLSLVVCFVLGFFMISIIYINSTKDRTSFMAKIVSITVVTMMFIMQSLSMIIMKDQDRDYDASKKDQMERVFASNHFFNDVEFIISFDLEKHSFGKSNYHESINIDLDLVQIDLQNTVIYDKIGKIPGENFRNDLLTLLQSSHPEFNGYKNSILSFMEQHKETEALLLKAELLKYFNELNQLTFVVTNKLSTIGNENFCADALKLLNSQKKAIHFTNILKGSLEACNWKGEQVELGYIRHEVNKFFRYFKPSLSRHYRKSMHSSESQRHFVSFSYYDQYRNKVYEFGFSYNGYRTQIHEQASIQHLILIIVVLGIMGFYPLFFRGSLLNPLQSLLNGVEKVNNGNLVVEVPVKVQDEIGFLADSFNRMVVSIRSARRELQNYTDTLEEKVKERTKEVEDKMGEVQKLKEQQDGDYYLTSLLAKPLFTNRNKSEITKTDFMIKQKKQFQFRNKSSELGGDICVSGNLRLGQKENYKRYTFALNGDAMGKSMQGAGGSLVMGVVVNSILARSARNDWVLESSPEKWLTDLYYEINRIFKSFNGSMVISCVAMLVDDDTGEVFYFNAEHPFCVLYRDGVASFLEETLMLRKLGLDSEIPFEVRETRLKPGDVLFLGSDGRDDIDLTPDEAFKTINEDENLFLKHVERGKGDLELIYKSILEEGTLTDDFSLVRLSYRESELDGLEHKDIVIEDALSEIDKLFEQGRDLAKLGKISEAYKVIALAFEKDSNFPKISKFYGLLAFKSRDYANAIKIMRDYLRKDPLYSDFWYYLGVSEKKLGQFDKALEAAFQLYTMNQEHVMNLINLADIKRMQGNVKEAKIYLSKAREIQPDNHLATRIDELISSHSYSVQKLGEDIPETLD
jgi:tetratricopeptide (TPR) repeat protein/HAMP domain-containing protein